EDRVYTYQEYLTWEDDERWEIIDGKLYSMSPAPNVRHQRLSPNFSRSIANYLHGKEYIPFAAPTDVVFSEHNVVQPDVFVVCDRRKITERNIQGAPDLIIEIFSPGTQKKDRWEKKRLYEKSGVREYLMVEPEGKFVEQYLLQENGRFHAGDVYSEDEDLPLK